MSILTSPASTETPATAIEVLDRVGALVPVLRSRARETEQLRHMHPDNLTNLTDAGIFKLTMPKDKGGYEADEYIVTEVLTQIARGCPSSSWICAIMLSVNFWPALLVDDAADEIYATPDLRMTGTIAPTGKATPVPGGYQVTGQWQWNTGGIHSKWIAPSCITITDAGPAPIAAIIPASEVVHEDNWNAAGMAGSATNILTVTDVFVPAERTIFIKDLADGVFPQRRYSDNPYFNRPAIMYFLALSAPSMLGMARGAMDVFMQTLATRGGITYTDYTKASEAPLTHHQLARAQFELEIAEMFMEKIRGLIRDTYGKDVPLVERVRTRAWLGQVAHHARACVNQLFEASSASQILLSSDLQRYFRDVNALHQHGLVLPTSSDEMYGRVLAGLAPNSALL
jgi:3-hydroxy-9,10-secoandrosta-1,3,5(10)-triene-9,17-dione monooxygenase